MRKLFIISIALFLSFQLLAIDRVTKQGDKVEGYIITIDNIKKEGLIKLGDWAENEVKVQFYEGNKKTVFKPNELSEYGFEITEINEQGNKAKRWVRFYQKTVDRAPMLFASKTVMMEREVEGDLNLYTYYIAKRDNVSQPFEYYFYIETKDGRFLKIDKKNYKTVAKQLFEDYSGLVQLVGKKGFLYGNLDRMINDYNYWVVNQHNSNEYRIALKNN